MTIKRRNVTRAFLTTESLEQRKLMAADAFQMPVHDVEPLPAQIDQTVGELSQLLQEQTSPEQFRLAQETGNPERIFETVDHDMWRQVVDNSQVPNLGPALGQYPQYEQALTDLVIMDLMGVDSSPEYVDVLSHLAGELDPLVQLPIQGGVADPLPPEFEQLRQELGDEAFGEWLQSNQEQSGNLQGVPEDVAHDWERSNPGAAEQFHSTEQALQCWLEQFTSQDPVVPGVTDGSDEPVVVIPGVNDGTDPLDVVIPGINDGAEQPIVILPGVNDGTDKPIVVIPDDVFGGEQPGVGDPGSSAEALPPQYEDLRQQMGDEGFAEWLHSNAERMGNLQGVDDATVEQLVDQGLAEQFEETEQALQKWLRNQEPQQPVDFLPPLEGDADFDGRVDFSDFLILSNNYGQVDATLAQGDFDLDGRVDFSDFLILANEYGGSVEVCSTDSSDANDPKDGTEIQNGGDMTIREGSIVFISDKTIDGDKTDLEKDAPKDTPIHDGMKSWQDVIDKIKDLKDGSITGDLVLSGHGADGGVDASGTDIDGQNLTAEQAEILKKKLGPNSRIVVLGCGQADAEDNDHMQRLANLTGRPVVGNQSGVSDGTNGEGDWFRFDPKK